MQALDDEEADSWIHESLQRYFVTSTIQALKEDTIQTLFAFRVADIAAWVHGWKPQIEPGLPDEDCRKVMISSYLVLHFFLPLMTDHADAFPLSLSHTLETQGLGQTH